MNINCRQLTAKPEDRWSFAPVRDWTPRFANVSFGWKMREHIAIYYLLHGHRPCRKDDVRKPPNGLGCPGRWRGVVEACRAWGFLRVSAEKQGDAGQGDQGADQAAAGDFLAQGAGMARAKSGLTERRV